MSAALPEEIEVRPQPGPQEAFCASVADIVVYGGAAGPGKSWALLFEAARNVGVPGYAGILFRRTKPELTGGGSLWEEAEKMYPLRGGTPRMHKLDWRFPANDGNSWSGIEFDGMQYEADKLHHQGKQYAFIGFDELTHFTEGQFWYLVGRNRSTCGIRPYIRATCNPDPDSFVRGLIDWWIDPDTGYAIPERAGVVRFFIRDGNELIWADTAEELRARFAYMGERAPEPLSFTFIPAKLSDNKKGDPTYRAKLQSLQSVDRERLLHGNWNIKASSGSFFKRGYFKMVPKVPEKVKLRTRAWDLASTKPSVENRDPDWSVGVKLSLGYDDTIYIEHVERMRESPGVVEDAIKNIARTDGKKCRVALWEDPGQAGKSQSEHFKKLLLGWILKIIKASRDKETYAKPASSAAEHGRIVIVGDEENPPAWVDPFLSTLEDFPPKPPGHDDDVDALSLAFMIVTSRDTNRLKGMVKWRKSPTAES